MNQLTAKDSATLAGVFDTALRCCSEGDFEAWAQLYAEDGILQPPNAPTVTGRPDLEAFLGSLPISSMTWSNVQVRGEGNIAYGTSSYWLKLNDQSEDTGKQLIVFQRIAVGAKWKVVAVSFNSDLPPATALP